MCGTARHPDAHERPHGEHRAGICSAKHLAEHLAEFISPRTCIVCVGNELCGDDGAGPAVARGLAGKVPWEVLDTQSCPESYLMKIVQLRPQTVILIDALHLATEAGTVDLVEAADIAGQGPSTHGPAPLAFLDLLNMLHPCRRVVLGIQPTRCEVGDPMSGPVLQAVEMVTRAFLSLAEDQERHSK